MKDCEPLIWPAIKNALHRDISISQADGACKVTLPFERVDQDAITLWVTERGDEFVISDEGETYGMLYLSNINLDQDRRKRRLQSISKRFDLEEAKYEIRLSADEDNLGDRVIDAVQAVQSISHLLYTRQQYTTSDFRNDVGEYLTDNSYEYTPNAEVQGATETHRVDFDIPTRTPTYLETLHAENVSTAHSMAQRTAFKWTDIEKAGISALRVSVLDDEAGEYDERTENILSEYSDEFVPWSSRRRLTDVLGSGSKAQAD